MIPSRRGTPEGGTATDRVRGPGAPSQPGALPLLSPEQHPSHFGGKSCGSCSSPSAGMRGDLSPGLPVMEGEPGGIPAPLPHGWRQPGGSQPRGWKGNPKFGRIPKPLPQGWREAEKTPAPHPRGCCEPGKTPDPQPRWGGSGGHRLPKPGDGRALVPQDGANPGIPTPLPRAWMDAGSPGVPIPAAPAWREPGGPHSRSPTPQPALPPLRAPTCRAGPRGRPELGGRSVRGAGGGAALRPRFKFPSPELSSPEHARPGPGSAPGQGRAEPPPPPVPPPRRTGQRGRAARPSGERRMEKGEKPGLTQLCATFRREEGEGSARSNGHRREESGAGSGGVARGSRCSTPGARYRCSVPGTRCPVPVLSARCSGDARYPVPGAPLGAAGSGAEAAAGDACPRLSPVSPTVPGVPGCPRCRDGRGKGRGSGNGAGTAPGRQRPA